MKISVITRSVGLVVLVVVIVVCLIYLPQAKQLLFEFLSWVRGLGTLGLVFIAAAYVLVTVFFVPGWILSVGAGFAFGVVKGTIAISVGSTLGAAAAFLLGRTLVRGWVESKITARPRFRAIDQAVQKQGFKIVLLTRLSPIFPFNLLNYAFGITKVPFWSYVLASWIGMLPVTIMYVYLGSALENLAELTAGEIKQGPAQRVFFWIGLLMAVTVAVLVTRISRKALKDVASVQELVPGQLREDAHA